MTSFAQRQPLLDLPWGDGANQLPYERTDMGGTNDDIPTQLVWVGKGIFWLGYPGSGTLYVVDTDRRRLSSVAFNSVLPPSWQAAIVYGYALARHPHGDMAVIVGARPAGSQHFRYQLIRLDVLGHPIAAIPLGQGLFSRNVPQHLTIDADGHYWVQSRSHLWILDAQGELISYIEKTRGVLLSSGVFISADIKDYGPLRLLDSNGQPGGEIAQPTSGEVDGLLAAGPDNLIIFEQSPESQDEEMAEQFHALAIAQVMPKQRELRVLSRFNLPTLRLVDRGSDMLANGSPILSYFPLEGIAFNDNGDLLLIEITPAKFQLHRMTRLSSVTP